MPIDFDTRVSGVWPQKWITAKQLMDAVFELRPDDKLYPNSVGNLAVVRDMEYIGYINMATGEVDLDEETP